MAGTIFSQGRCTKVCSRFVRRRWAYPVGINQIPEKQKKIEPLSAYCIEDGISGCATPAASLATQIAATGKGHRHMTVHIRKRRKFPSCSHSCFRRHTFTPFCADKSIPSV